MKRTPLTRTAPLRSGGRALTRRKRLNPVNRERRAAEFARCYHSKERVEWVKGWACVSCGKPGPSDNAHVLHDGTRGMGRKAGFACIAPLCRNCHEDFDQGRMSLRRSLDCYVGAGLVQERWLAHLAATNPEKP